MEVTEIGLGTPQPSPAKRRRGPGRPFAKGGDPRINKGGVPSEIRAFHNWLRESFAAALQVESEEGLTNGQHIIRTLIQKAKDGDMRAIEYVLDRMGGKPSQTVELGGSVGPSVVSEAEIARLNDMVERIKGYEAAEARRNESQPSPLSQNLGQRRPAARF
jgi:hypothetical protein